MNINKNQINNLLVFGNFYNYYQESIKLIFTFSTTYGFGTGTLTWTGYGLSTLTG